MAQSFKNIADLVTRAKEIRVVYGCEDDPAVTKIKVIFDILG